MGAVAITCHWGDIKFSFCPGKVNTKHPTILESDLAAIFSLEVVIFLTLQAQPVIHHGIQDYLDLREWRYGPLIQNMGAKSLRCPQEDQEIWGALSSSLSSEVWVKIGRIVWSISISPNWCLPGANISFSEFATSSPSQWDVEKNLTGD